MILDCRHSDFTASGFSDSILALVTGLPSPEAMHVYLPSSAPAVRRLQFTLQSLGCAVFRVTKFLQPRY